MKIVRLETDLLRVPLPRAVSLPTSQDPRSAKDVDVVVGRIVTDGPHVGLGFTYSFGGGASIRSLLDSARMACGTRLQPKSQGGAPWPR